ncbi:MAG: DUF262 domain-containing protein [Marinobacterium sp.]|nr:DUF262 domain-containing protein [Marinobacterium sp.]
MSVSVASCSASQLLNGEVIYVDDGQRIEGQLCIPEYQRPYCWQERELAALLSDIQAHLKESPKLPYYLGSLILHQQGHRLNIIDGQQRITTLAIIGFLNGQHTNSSLKYTSPGSQQQIRHNLAWLKKNQSQWVELVSSARLEFTLVITQSEDDAYRFFETQNTGGRRLSGPDIIKAHHLRAVEAVHQAHFAKRWEALGELDGVVQALLKGRYWQNIDHRVLPSHRQPKQVRDCIVSEFAEQTGKGLDVAFGRVKRIADQAGRACYEYDQQGYDVRQPLNAGVNTIAYLSYFQQLRNRYWLALQLPHLAGYVEFCRWLKQREGCGFLEDLFETCLLMYICQFGESQLEIAAKKIFRVVYSRRVSNQKTVRENSIPAFIRETPVLDWITQSYTPEQCFQLLDRFELKVDTHNINVKNSVKKRFLKAVNQQFELKLDDAELGTRFASELTEKISNMGRA